ncbi:MAG: DNA polymerase III subunit epsilon [Rhodospirillaceae bacterium]|nr:DNA polymerase III subunit epsilon [Rhodospirillaceae bacterium]
MREIVLDTETTGLDPKSGHRVVEIGCVELINHMATDNTYWTYINPERDMPEEAFRVHGLSAEFLEDKLKFADIADGFLEFIGGDPLIIHNADFDMGFLNAELAACGRQQLEMGRAIDTVRMARQKFPGSPANLDALCRRFQIDNSDRELHGALKDSRLLADVYLELIGGRQQHLALAGDKQTANAPCTPNARAHRPSRPHTASSQELADHQAFVERLKEPVWRA